MKILPILVVTNALALGLAVVLYFQQDELKSQLASARSGPVRQTEVATDPFLDARLARLERELASWRGLEREEADATPAADLTPEGTLASSAGDSRPVAERLEEGALPAPEGTSPEMEAFRQRVRRALELNREEDQFDRVMESVDRLVSEGRIASMTPRQREKVAKTILDTRERVGGVFRKVREDPGFRELPAEERRATVRAEIETLRVEAQQSLEQVIPPTDAKIVADTALGGGDFQPMGRRGRPN